MIFGDVQARDESVRDARSCKADRLAVTEPDLKHVIRRLEREQFERLKIERSGLGGHYVGQNVSEQAAGTT